jgi:phospholipase/lecithinase/hemolysin
MSMGMLGQVGGAGYNYAIGGARTGDSGALGLLDFFMPTGLFRQVDFYLSESGGLADPQALYFFLGGGNDLRDAARIANPASRMLAAQQAGANIAYSVRDLYAAGARQFVLINSPDIGLIPETLADGLTEAGTDAAIHFNTWFAAYGDYLRDSVPEFSLTSFDLFGLHHELVAEYGIDAVRPCKSEPAICGETLFFDSVHPTARVHEIIGNRLADQILGVDRMRLAYSSAANTHTPEPSTWVLVVSASAAGLLARLRGRSRTRALLRRRRHFERLVRAAAVDRRHMRVQGAQVRA